MLFNQLKKNGLKKKFDKNRKKYSKKLKRRGGAHSKSLTIHKKRLKKADTSRLEKKEHISAVVGVVAQFSANSSTKPTAENEENRNEKSITAPAKSNDEEKIVSITTDNVNDQIREQLKLLQSGRRSSISLLTSSAKSDSISDNKTTSCNSTPSFSRQPSPSSLDNETTKAAGVSKTNSVTETSPIVQKPKFIDSLISKLKTKGVNLPDNDSNTSLGTHSTPEKSLPAQKLITECEPNTVSDSGELSDHSTSSKNDFLGFEAQFEQPSIPGMLPTPVVRKPKGVVSAFLSEDLDNFLTENALDNSSYKIAPLKKRRDEALMYAEAEPPTLCCPQLPSGVEKPRTVAEKRQLLERKADIKYLMIENESTVYRELKKRAKTAPVTNYKLIRNIQEMNIPFTRDCWRATCWLNTQNGRFYYQTIIDNEKEVKVLGGRGNNSVKELVKLQPIDKKKYVNRGCSKTCKPIGNIKINGLDDIVTEQSTSQSSETTYSSKKLNTLSDDYSFQKSCPLSMKKLDPIKSSIDVELGPLQLYHLPLIELEVWPLLDRPLPDSVHPYLKLVLPHEKMTNEWAEFAVSTLKQNIPPPSRRKRRRTITPAESRKFFTFNVPYANNQNRILIRKRRQITPSLTELHSINDTEKTKLNFMQNVDPNDDVAVAVADALSDMINSVALTLCEGTVIRDDPDIEYNRVDAQVESGGNKFAEINAVDGKKQKTPTGKIVKELKKLNAKIIHGYDTIQKEECKNDFCKLGCVCDSLRGSQAYTNHCKELNCMFQCKCPINKANTNTFESAAHNSDIKQYCDRVNATLAKEEKAFTATVVVSEGKTIYVPTWSEKKKRLKKVPKRLTDCVQFENDFVHRDLSEKLLTTEESRQRDLIENGSDLYDRVLTSNKNEIVKNLIHVNVNLERQNAFDCLEPWCMVHCLYKCFCKFKAIEGQRFEFGNTKIDEIEQPTYTKKRQYTFEQNEPAAKRPAKYPTNVTTPAVDESDNLSSRRVLVVATKKHLIVNRARAEDIRRRIKKIEVDHPELQTKLKKLVRKSLLLPEVRSKRHRGNSERSNKKESDVKTLTHSDQQKQIETDESVSETSLLPENDSVETEKYRSRFNTIIMKTMQGISGKLKKMVELPSPVNKAFYYMQWKHFLEAFNADRIFIWEVQLSSKEFLLVATDKNDMPIVSNAMYVINIKAVSTERLPLLPKLIKRGVTNEETGKMSILLFGILNYWRVLGCTHSIHDFLNERVVAVPTPTSNPKLALKISHLFNDMVKLTANCRNKDPSLATSNVCILELDVNDFRSIKLPLPVVGNHRWLMLSLANDFSHIYVPTWKQTISLEKILPAMEQATKAQKTIRMGPTNAKPHLYVTPDSNMKIFFGPIKKDELLDLQLLEQIDGKMLLREEYQRTTNQQPTGITTGTWLYMKDETMEICGTSDGGTSDGGTSDGETAAGGTAVGVAAVAATACSVKAVASTAVASTAVADTTVAHTTVAHTTVAHTTVAHTTVAHTTVAHTTVADTTVADTTVVDTTVADTAIGGLAVGDKKPDQPLRTYPPKLKLVGKMSSAGFIPLKPSTVTSSNMNITVLPSSSSESPTPCTTTSASTPNVPTSELIRHLSLGLRARPAKVDKSPIKVVDTALLMSPRFLTVPSKSTTTDTSSPPAINQPATSNSTKSITLSYAPNMQSHADWKDVSKGVPIRARRFTTFVPDTSKPTLKSLLQKPVVSKTLETFVPPSTIGPMNPTTSKQQNLPGQIRERRFTTIVSSGTKTLVKNPPQNVRPPITAKNFELIQQTGNKLTLAPIPVTQSLHQSLLNRSVILKRVGTIMPSELRKRSKTIDHNLFQANVVKTSLPQTKPIIVQPTTSALASKAIPPVLVVNPSSANIPKKTTAITSDGKKIIVTKLAPTVRILPSNFKLLSTSTKNIKDSTEVIDIDNESQRKVPKKPETLMIPKVPAQGDTVNGFIISQIRPLGKIMARKLYGAYSVNLPGGSKLFQTFKNCTDYVNNIYIKDAIFAMVPAHLVIDWRFVAQHDDHSTYALHTQETLLSSMVLTRDELIDLNGEFDSNERYSLDLRHHLLVLRLAYTCMRNVDARNKTGLEIVRRSEEVIREMRADNERLKAILRELRIKKDTNVLKLSELQKKMSTPVSDEDSSEPTMIVIPDEIITIDSDDD
ncbi:MAX gene-associated protein [Pseudolycoriella hygida]|uniref:MAX gene-associated protein n=1 Tax=Pseudolycoriella hygida TaxID=35572 RepID=A0A9Q0MMK6_9DIPT|nr:MAX gene-associated protein [Pseudolycoriella hygida]